jgi:hypothetical protein
MIPFDLRDYSMQFSYSKEDFCFLCRVEQCPGLIVEGSSMLDCLSKVSGRIKEWLEVNGSLGRPHPIVDSITNQSPIASRQQ